MNGLRRALGAFGVVLVVAGVPAGCSSARDPYQERRLSELTAALREDGLELCGPAGDLAPANQATRRTAIHVAVDCHEGIATIVADRFASAEDRDAAARAFEGQARPRADGALWTWGPFTLLVTGPRDGEVTDRLTEVLDGIGAR